MEWYWIVLIVLAVLVAALFLAGFLFFLYVCWPAREQAASLDGNERRALKNYVPIIKRNALENAAKKHELVAAKAHDGIELRAKLYPNVKSDRFVILVHGYHSSSPWDFGMSFGMLYRAGYSILAVDDRAHGLSGGRYVGFGAHDSKDVRSWMDYLVSRFGPEIRIALMGVSMGAGSVMLAAGNCPVPQLACTVEDCGYSTWTEEVEYLVRIRKVPPRLLTAIASLWSKLLNGVSFGEANCVEAMKKTTTPVLFLHGTGDKFVPFEMMDRVYTACAGPKERVAFEDAIHGESSYKYPERYEKVLLDWMGKYL